MSIRPRRVNPTEPDRVPVIRSGSTPNSDSRTRKRRFKTHVHKYVPILLDRIQKGEIDPSFVITHKLPLSEAPHGYQMFNEKRDGCVKIVLKP